MYKRFADWLGLPLYSEDFLHVLESPEGDALYRAFLEDLQETRSEEIEIHHQLRWIGNMIGTIGDAALAYVSQGKVKTQLSVDYAPVHWQSVRTKPKTMKDRVREDRQKAQAMPTIKIGKR